MVNNAVVSADSTVAPAVFSGKPSTRTWCVWQNETKRFMDGMVLGWDTKLLLTTAMFLVIDAAFLLTDNFFIAARFLEPPLKRGRPRIRCMLVALGMEHVWRIVFCIVLRELSSISPPASVVGAKPRTY
jgi:hypothetical protein